MIKPTTNHYREANATASHVIKRLLKLLFIWTAVILAVIWVPRWLAASQGMPSLFWISLERCAGSTPRALYYYALYVKSEKYVNPSTGGREVVTLRPFHLANQDFERVLTCIKTDSETVLFITDNS